MKHGAYCSIPCQHEYHHIDMDSLDDRDMLGLMGC